MSQQETHICWRFLLSSCRMFFCLVITLSITWICSGIFFLSYLFQMDCLVTRGRFYPSFFPDSLLTIKSSRLAAQHGNVDKMVCKWMRGRWCVTLPLWRRGQSRTSPPPHLDSCPSFSLLPGSSGRYFWNSVIVLLLHLCVVSEWEGFFCFVLFFLIHETICKSRMRFVRFASAPVLISPVSCEAGLSRTYVWVRPTHTYCYMWICSNTQQSEHICGFFSPIPTRHRLGLWTPVCQFVVADS